MGLSGTNQPDTSSMLPPELDRHYQLFILHGTNAKKHIQKMRDMKAS